MLFETDRHTRAKSGDRAEHETGLRSEVYSRHLQQRQHKLSGQHIRHHLSDTAAGAVKILEKKLGAIFDEVPVVISLDARGALSESQQGL